MQIKETYTFDYYPFGMLMPGRSYSSTAYKYGFNGQEKDDEVAGSGNINTAMFWEYDTRLGRRWNLDPKPETSYSSYSVLRNNPIWFTDPFGDTTSYDFFSKKDKPSFHLAAAKEVEKQIYDNVFIVYAHSSSSGFIYFDEDGNKKSVTTATQFKILMDEKTNGEFSKSLQKAKEDGTEVKVIFKSCNLASNDFYDEHFGQGIVHTDKTFAQRVAKGLSLSIVAPDGYALYSSDPNKPGVVGYHNQDGDAGLLTINNKGEIVSKKQIQHAKPSKHALGKNRGLVKGIDSKQIIKKL